MGICLSAITATLLSLVTRKAPYRLMIVGAAVSCFYLTLALSSSLLLALLLNVALATLVSSFVERILWKKFLSFSIQEFDKSVSTGLAWVSELEKKLAQMKNMSAQRNPASAHNLARKSAELSRYIQWLDEQFRRIEGIKVGRNKRKVKPNDFFKTELERKAWWHSSVERLNSLHLQADQFEQSMHSYLESNSDDQMESRQSVEVPQAREVSLRHR